MGGLLPSGPVGLDAVDPWVVVRRMVRLSPPRRWRCRGDMDGDDLPGVGAAEDDLLPGDHDDAGIAGPPLGGDRLGRQC